MRDLPAEGGLADGGAVSAPSKEWIEDCLKWRGVVLTGEHAHWCFDWDGLPVDETCDEWPCDCFDEHPRIEP